MTDISLIVEGEEDIRFLVDFVKFLSRQWLIFDPAGQPIQGEFAYTASGVIIGSKPAVVLTSDSGKQMLVTLGSSIDGDSKVVGISKNKITIRHKNKTFTVSVGGNSSGK